MRSQVAPSHTLDQVSFPSGPAHTQQSLGRNRTVCKQAGTLHPRQGSVSHSLKCNEANLKNKFKVDIKQSPVFFLIKV